MASSALYNRIFDTKVFLGGGKSNKFKPATFMKLLYDKRNFFILTFSNLIVQLGITYYIFEKTPADQIKGVALYLLIFALFAIILVISLPIPMWAKFILFCTFSFLQGLFLSIIKSRASASVLQSAFFATMGIFAFMFSVGISLILFGVYLTNNVGFFLLISLLLLIIFQIISMFTGTFNMLQKVFSFIGLIIFSAYIIYDTNTILQRNYYGDFITASLDYYLDIINIYLDIVNLNN